MKERKAFNFYKSYDDAFEALSSTKQVMLFKAIRDVQFFRIHVNKISFNDNELKFAWLIIKHSIESQVLGFCRADKVNYDDLFVLDSATETVTIEDTPKDTPKVTQQQEQEKEEEQEEVQQVVVETEASTIASYLLNKIKEFKPNFVPTGINNWIRDIDRAMRIDGRTHDELIGCINWIYSPAGEFWKPNILSGKKLREKFDTMEAQMMRSGAKNKRTMDNLAYIAGERNEI